MTSQKNVGVNSILSKNEKVNSLILATRNQDKVNEFSRILGVTISGIDLNIPEIQDSDPIKVLEQKAKDAWLANGGQPIMVEDTSLTCLALYDYPGTFADH